MAAASSDGLGAWAGQKILVAVAHPDDEAIACGGTIARAAALGCQCRVLLPFRRCDPRGRKHWQALIGAFERSCDTLGAVPVLPAHLIDERRAETDLAEVHDLIVPQVEWADRVLTHWWGDANQVHRGLSRAVEVATRPFRRRRDVLLFEVATSTDQVFSNAFTPNAFVLLKAAHVEAKCAAMEQYSTEFEPGRLPDDLRLKARVRGAEAGTEYAEAFAMGRTFL